MRPLPLLLPLFALGCASIATACLNGPQLPRVESPLSVLRREPPAHPSLRTEPIEPGTIVLPTKRNAPSPPPKPEPAGHTVTEQTAQQIYQVIIREYEGRRVRSLKARLPDEIANYTAALVYSGRAKDAIPVLLEFEALRPGQYATATNLGTAYELTGDLPRALEWITEGVRRNPRSHQGSEWVHVAILQTRLKLRDDSGWLAAHSVLDGAEARPANVTVDAIEAQLNERLRFVRPTDPVVADLFYEAGRRMTDPADGERRRFYFEQSLRFGPLRRAEISKL